MRGTSVRKIGWLMVARIVVAAFGHYSVYSATCVAPFVRHRQLGLGGLGLVVLGLFFVQFRS